MHFGFLQNVGFHLTPLSFEMLKSYSFLQRFIYLYDYFNTIIKKTQQFYTHFTCNCFFMLAKYLLMSYTLLNNLLLGVLMLDIKLIREKPDFVKEALLKKAVKLILLNLLSGMLKSVLFYKRLNN